MTRITILNKVETTNYMSDMVVVCGPLKGKTSRSYLLYPHLPVAINNPGYFPNTVPPALFSEY
jgi:hypothetical protein